MAFSDFDLKTVRERFGLTTDEGQDLFSGTPALDVPAFCVRSSTHGLPRHWR